MNQCSIEKGQGGIALFDEEPDLGTCKGNALGAS
jgi:hypothetical protein